MSHRWHWVGVWGVSVLAVAMLASIGRAETGAAPAVPGNPPAPSLRPGTVRVALFDSSAITGSHGPVSLNNALSEFSDISFRHVTPQDIRDGILRQFDVVMLPGGSGKSEAAALNETGCNAIKTFVAGGGGYVGFCAGSYLASSQFPWSLGILNAKVVDPDHWARGDGTVTIRLNDQGRSLLGAHDNLVKIYYGQGPLLGPGDNKNVAPMTVLATFETEIDKNGAPPGTMIGTVAIANGVYGKGRVWCFSPHPEKTKDLHDFVHRAVFWTVGKTPSAQPPK